MKTNQYSVPGIIRKLYLNSIELDLLCEEKYESLSGNSKLFADAIKDRNLLCVEFLRTYPVLFKVTRKRRKVHFL